MEIKFAWLNKIKIDDIPFLKNNYEKTNEVINLSNKNINVMKVKDNTDKIYSEMIVLERCGFLRLIKDIQSVSTVDDIIPFTRKVQKIESSPTYLKIFFPNHTFILSESELMTPTTFKKCLLRLGKFIYISNKKWVKIVQMWLAMSETIAEETEDEQIIDIVLNYLSDCVIHEDIDKTVSRNTLYYNSKEKNLVYCFSDALMEVINYKKTNEISNRKLRAILSDYVVDKSRIRIFGKRYSFWKFDIIKSGVNIEKQMFDKELLKKELNEKDGVIIKQLNDTALSEKKVVEFDDDLNYKV